MKAGNQTLLKKNNQRAIAEYIIENGPISRADLSKRLKISKPTVSANIADLLELDLLKEIGYCETEIGKKPMLVDFNKDHQYVLAVDFISYLARSRISVAVCNLYCEPVFIDSFEIPYLFSAETIIECVPKNILPLLKSHKIPQEKIGKVVITAPSSSFDDKHIYLNCRQGGRVNIADAFIPYFEGKIAVKNDVNLAVLGEKYFGAGRDYSNIFFAWIGLAVGGGLILNGELYEGKDRSAGEIAYALVYDEDSGRYDYLKNFTSMPGIVDYIKAHKEEALASAIGPSVESGYYYLDMIVDAALAGDEFCIKFGKRIGKMVGTVLSNLNITLNLEMIVLGGEYSRFSDIIIDEIYRILKAVEPEPKTLVQTPEYSNSAMYGSFKFGADNIIQGLI